MKDVVSLAVLDVLSWTNLNLPLAAISYRCAYSETSTTLLRTTSTGPSACSATAAAAYSGTTQMLRLWPSVS